MRMNENVSSNLDFVKSKYKGTNEVKKDSKIELYYPNSAIKRHLKDNTISLFVSLFGGCTVSECTGYYLNDAGSIDYDNISIIYSYSSIKHLAKIQNHAKMLCEELKQECILLVIDNETYFIKGGI